MKKSRLTKIWFRKIDLHVELFRCNNILQARWVVLNVLARGNSKMRERVLKQVRPKQITQNFERFLFEAMVESVQREGKVDIEQVRCNIPLWLGTSSDPKSTAKCLANYARLLTYRPTEAQVERAIWIITTPPPPPRIYETKSTIQAKGTKPKRVPKGH